MTMSYAYPDGDDRLTRAWFEGPGEAFCRYSRESDRLVLQKTKQWLGSTPSGHKTSLLDVGCGEGRLIAELAADFRRIVAVEPDAARLARAKEAIRRAGLENKVEISHNTIEDLDDCPRFDAVVCSHVLQHVHTRSAPIILRKLRELLVPGGRLALGTCHAVTGEESFDQSLLREGRLVVEPVSRERFDALIHNRDGILPCRYFTEPDLLAMLDAAGFEVIEAWLYHVDAPSFDELGGAGDIDARINADPDLRRRMGVDILVLAEARISRS